MYQLFAWLDGIVGPLAITIAPVALVVMATLYFLLRRVLPSTSLNLFWLDLLTFGLGWILIVVAELLILGRHEWSYVFSHFVVVLIRYPQIPIILAVTSVLLFKLYRNPESAFQLERRCRFALLIAHVVCAAWSALFALAFFSATT